MLTALAAVPALAHSGANLQAPAENLSLGATLFEFSKYGAKHILLGYDHLLFLAALVLLSAAFRDVAAIIGLFAISYSATLIGATLLGIAVPGDLIDAIIALSVGYVGVQLAFGSNPGRINRDPRPPAFVFGLAHGLGLSALLQELQLPGNDVLPSVIGFNIGVELGQIGAMALFLAILLTCRAFPFPARQRLPAGSGFIAVAAVLLAFVVLGLDL